MVRGKTVIVLLQLVELLTITV